MGRGLEATIRSSGLRRAGGGIRRDHGWIRIGAEWLKPRTNQMAANPDRMYRRNVLRTDINQISPPLGGFSPSKSPNRDHICFKIRMFDARGPERTSSVVVASEAPGSGLARLAGGSLGGSGSSPPIPRLGMKGKGGGGGGERNVRTERRPSEWRNTGCVFLRTVRVDGELLCSRGEMICNLSTKEIVRKHAIERMFEVVFGH